MNSDANILPSPAAAAAAHAPSARAHINRKAGPVTVAVFLGLLIAAILWSLGTWWLGLPASSSLFSHLF